MSLEASIIDSIRQNLPTATADYLSKFIEQSKQLEQKCKQLEHSLANSQEQSTVALREAARLKSFEQRYEELNKKERELETRERNLKVTLLELELKESKERAGMMNQLVSMVFRNPRITLSESGSVPVASNGYVSTFTTTKNVTQEIE
jgi:predicted RNase H-like nuclease (RuvC/YqgF family)